MKKTTKPNPQKSQAFVYPLILIALWFGLFLIRVSAPYDYMDDDQQRPISYAMDAYHNGNWIVQVDDTGDVQSKPPFSTWMIALVSIFTGGVTRLALVLPSALSVLGMSLLLYIAAARNWGANAAFAAGLAFLASQVALRQMILLRSDPVFSIIVFGSLLLLGFCLSRKPLWLLLWLLLAIGTLTKGPLALLLVAGGLGVLLWNKLSPAEEHDSDEEETPWYGSGKIQLIGLSIFLIIAGGWFLLAYWELRTALIDKMVRTELVGHALEGREHNTILNTFYRPTFYAFARFLPWSIPAFVGLFLVFWKPSRDPKRRFTERLLASYIFIGLIIFSFASHKRADHLYPLFPAFAIFAGIVIDRYLLRQNGRKTLQFATVTSAVILVYTAGYYHFYRPATRDVLRTTLTREFATKISENLDRGIPVNVRDKSYAIQYFRGTMLRRIEDDQILTAIKNPEPFYFVARDTHILWWTAEGQGTRLHILEEWPDEDRKAPLVERLWRAQQPEGTLPIRLLSNVDYFSKDEFQVYANDFYLRVSNASARRVTPALIDLIPSGREPRVTLKNISTQKATYRVRNANTGASQRYTLGPGEEMVVLVNNL